MIVTTMVSTIVSVRTEATIVPTGAAQIRQTKACDVVARITTAAVVKSTFSTAQKEREQVVKVNKLRNPTQRTQLRPGHGYIIKVIAKVARKALTIASTPTTGMETIVLDGEQETIMLNAKYPEDTPPVLLLTAGY